MNRSFAPKIGTASFGIALFTALVGAVVLLGWAWDITALKSILPGWVSVKPNTALGFILCGVALALLGPETPARWAKRAGTVCAAAVTLLGALTLAQYLFGVDFGLDQMLFRDDRGAVQTSHPGRMAPVTAFNFIFCGVALLLLDVSSRRGRRPAQFVILLPIATSFLAVLGYLYGSRPLYQVAALTSIALPSALTFFPFGLGVWLARPSAGWVAVFTNHDELWSTILDGAVWEGDITNRRKDGTLYHEHMTVTPVQDHAGEIKHFVAIKQDITEQRRLEEQLNQAQKMEAIGRLAGGVAHDFNNMLMVVSSYADLLLQRSSDPELVRSYAEQIHEASSRAAGITQQLLAFSRKQVMLPTVIHLNQVVSSLIKILRSLLREDIQVDVVAAPDLALVKADSGQVGQILMNLAVNARDAMPTGGRFVIETANVQFDAEILGAQRMPPGSYVMLAVTDNGCGMDEATRAHIFDPFFTTKEQGEGTGLGLSTVYGIVKQSGGFIWVYSEPGQGTTFKIYLPRAVEEHATTAVERVASPAVTTCGTESVLVVEDEVALRSAMCAYLESRGYKVYSASNAAAALHLCSEQPGIAILVTDLVMPGMGGAALARLMEERIPGLPVIYISGYTENTVDASQFLARGTLLQKPFRLQELVEKMRFVLDTDTSAAAAGA